MPVLRLISGAKRTRKRREQASSPFHIALLSSKTCGLLHHANLEIRVMQCLLPSVVKDRRSAHLFPIGTSPLPAERGFGLEPIPRVKSLLDNKKPGFERRAIPSIPWATHSVRPLGRMCSMLGCFLSGVGNQPHLIMVGRPGPSATSPQIRAPPTSGEYIRIQNPVKLHSRFFYVRLTHLGVNSTAPVEIQGSTQAFVAQALMPVSFC